MSSDTNSLMEVAAVIDSSHQTPTYVTNGVPMARVTDVKYGVLKLGSALHVSIETFENYSRRFRAKPRDIIISRVGSYGNTSWVVDTKFCLGQNVASISPTKIDPRYLYYVLNSPLISLQIEEVVVGSTQKSLSLKAIKELKIPRLAANEEKEIGSFLGALDDRITLLRGTNTTLEAIAQALFKSWFVDFDPVHAKQQGREPEGMDASTADLFPDSFEESELGLVPMGWRVDTIKNRASNIQYGFTQSSTTMPVGPQFLRITDIRGGVINWDSVPFCESSMHEREKYRVLDGDIFVARTGASTGENIYVVEPPNAVFASYLIRIQFASPGVGRIVGEFMRTSTYKNYVTGNIGGSAQPNANAQTLAGASMIFPPEELSDMFYKIVRTLDLIKAANDRQSRTLENLRDTLLPRLIAGQLRLPDSTPA